MRAWLAEVEARQVTMRRYLAEFPWKDWDAGRVNELVDEHGVLLALVRRAVARLIMIRDTQPNSDVIVREIVMIASDTLADLAQLAREGEKG